MTPDERALLVAGLLMDYPSASYGQILAAVDEAAAAAVSAVNGADVVTVALAQVEQLARASLDALRRQSKAG